MTNNIEQFQGDYRWLSNFAECEVFMEGVLYPSVENAYQAAKTLNIAKRLAFENCSAAQAKRLAQTLDIRKDWSSVKKSIMYNLVNQKFHKEPYMSALLSTKQVEIQEGNTWGDTFWGVDLRSGRGQNILGKIIMTIRAELNGWG